jgi:hypothetical protein
MPRDRKPAGTCSKCQGPVTCSYNSFQNGPERIDSWEHRCGDCSHRETKAVRIGGEQAPEEGDPKICPFCGRSAP